MGRGESGQVISIMASSITAQHREMRREVQGGKPALVLLSGAVAGFGGCAFAVKAGEVYEATVGSDCGLPSSSSGVNGDALVF
ncbi:MAG: hypothetical protein ACYTBJ_06040 [Planctomycetota bacterium]|jgi:hypothetical protein